MALCHYLYRYQYNVLHLCNIFIIQYTFAYSAIADWNSLPNNVKTIKNENKFKESLKKTILKDARKSKENPYIYHDIYY